MSDSLQPHGLQPIRLFCPWRFSRQACWRGCHALLQGDLPTQGLTTVLSYCRQILYHLSHQGSPRILEWVAYPFSSVSSGPRNGAGVSCIAHRFFTSWASREALQEPNMYFSKWNMSCVLPITSLTLEGIGVSLYSLYKASQSNTLYCGLSVCSGNCGFFFFNYLF